MQVLSLEPTRWWTADDRQEARLLAEGGGRIEVRSTAGAVIRDVPDGDSVVTMPSSPTTTELQLLFESGRRERRPWNPGRRWDLVAMATGHVDVYSTQTFDRTPEEHAAMLDAALDLCTRFDGFRYQIENLLPVVEYRDRRTARFGELVDRIGERRIGVGAQLTGIHHGEATGEELVQAHLAFGHRLGVRPNCGYTCDVPAATAQYRQLLAQLGIPRWIYSPNRFPPPTGFYGVAELLARLPMLGRAFAPDGSAVLTWIPPVHYGEHRVDFGLECADVDAMRAVLDGTLATLEPQCGPGSVYPLEVSAGDNLPIGHDLVTLVEAWQARYAWPRVRFATAADVFDAVEAGSIELPEWRGEIGDTWAWIVANQAALNPVMRDVVRRAVAAEVAAAVSRLPHPTSADDALLQAAKYESHDWWYAGQHVMGVPDLAKAEFARLAAASAERALAPLRGEVALLDTSGVERRTVVALPRGSGQLASTELVRAHFDPRPSSRAMPTDAATAPLVVSVRELRPFEGVPFARDPIPAPSVSVPDVDRFENEHYGVTLGAAGVVSLVDRRLGRELTAAPLGRLRVGTPQYEGAGIGFHGTKESAANDMRASFTSSEDTVFALANAWHGPVFSAALMRGRVHTSPASLAVVLYDEVPRVDVTVVVDWDGRPEFARLFAELSFDVGALYETRYEVPFGSVVAGAEAPVGPATLRMTGRWVSFDGSDAAVAIASPDCGVVAFGDPSRTLADLAVLERPDRASAHFVLADTGAPSPLVQGGRLVARFAITSRAEPFRPSEATRFAAGVVEPVLPVRAPVPGWRIAPANVVPTVLKPAWDGNGLVLRLVECDGTACDVTIDAPFPLREVLDARPDESPFGPAEQPIRLHPYEIRTLLLRSSPEHSPDRAAGGRVAPAREQRNGSCIGPV